MFIVSKVQSDQHTGRVVGNDLYVAATQDDALRIRRDLIESNAPYFGEVVPDVVDDRTALVHAGAATLITYDIREV